jgi:chromosomal replication initiator protein
MEGDLQRLIQEAEINHQEITLELAEKILKTPVRSQTVAPRPDGRMILDTVCAFYALPIKAIKGQKRDRLIARPRQTLMYLLKKHTGMTLMEIAEALGGRDHTTIIHGIRQIETLLPGNSRLQDEIAQIESKLDSRF